MKKKRLIGGAIALAAAAGACLFWKCAESTESNAIRMHLNGKQPVPDFFASKLDLNGNGNVDRMDYLKSKLHAFGSGQALYPAYFTADQAKQLGRTAFHPETGTLWCGLSGTGIEFSFYGKECTLSLTGDTACSLGDTVAARYAVYLNDALVTDTQLTEQEQSVTLTNTADEETPARVKLIKLSESAQSSVGIREICIASSRRIFSQYQNGLLIPADPKPHLIEFIGDSITCGYGVDGQYGVDPFKTANENVMKSYAYLTAEALNADYSMVSYSGHGIISGYTTNGKALTSQLVPRFYAQTGHCSAVLENRHKIQDDIWSFAVQPDLIVINLGTNDSSYTGTDAAKQKEFVAGYTEFLKKIREKNPDAPILCTLGIMGQTLCDAVELAADTYTKETGDTNIRTMRFDMQSEADGVVVDWHPSAVTHQKAADKLSGVIRDWLGW